MLENRGPGPLRRLPLLPLLVRIFFFWERESNCQNRSSEARELVLLEASLHLALSMTKPLAHNGKT